MDSKYFEVFVILSSKHFEVFDRFIIFAIKSESYGRNNIQEKTIPEPIGLEEKS